MHTATLEGEKKTTILEHIQEFFSDNHEWMMQTGAIIFLISASICLIAHA